MRAFVLHGHGGLDQLRFHADGPTPSPGVGEALIRVRACGLNNTDINTRTGWYSKAVREATSRGTYNGDLDKDGGWDGGIEFPRIQGGDAAGIVVRVGEGVDEALIGQRCPVDPIVRDWSDPASIEKTSYLGSARDGFSAKPELAIIPDADACGEPVASCGA
ncbi:MAG: alcohol dehydrogenase catalytic domain-containing protein [Pseudomonadota bacterium]